jgi:TP901 family phage tail tape measure protein
MSGSLVKQITMAIVADPGDSHEVLSGLNDDAEKLAGPHNLVLTAEGEEAQASLDSVQAALDKYEESLADVTEAQARFDEIQSDSGASADEYAAAQDKVTEATLRSLDAQVELGNAELAASAKAAESSDAQDDSAVKTDAAGVAAEGTGHRLGLLALGAGAVAAGSIYMAMKWQEASTELVTGAGQSEAGLAKVKAGMLAISTQTATSSTQIQAGMYMIESAGFHGAAGLDVLKAAAEGAKVGNADLGDVANAVTSALVAYKLPASAAVAVTNELVATVAAGKMHMADLTTSLANVLPVAASAHISFAQVGGALATMTSQGMTARRATTDLAFLIRALISPSAESAAEMKNLGLNANKVGADIGKVGLTGTLNELTEAILRNSKGGSALAATFAGMDPATQAYARGILSGKVTTEQLTLAMEGMNPVQAGLLSSFEKTASGATGVKTTFDGAMKTMVGGATGLNAALLIGGKHMSTFEGDAASVGAAAAHAGKDVQGWGDVTKDAAFKLDQAKTAGENLGISVGSVLLPAVTSILSPLASAASWLANNKDAAVALSVVVGGVLAAYIGVKAVSAFNAVKSAVSDVGQGMTWLGTKLGILAGEQEAETAATEAATVAQGELAAAEDATGIGELIVGLVLLAAVIYEVVKHWKMFEDAGKDAFRFVEHAAEDAFHWVEHNWPLILGILLGPIALASALIYMHWRGIVTGAEDAIHDIGSWFGRLPGMVLSWVSSFGHLLWSAGADLLHGLIGGIESEVGDVVSETEHVGDSILHGIEGALGIGSPSKFTFVHGQMLGEGLRLGMTSSIPMLEEASRRMGMAALSGLHTPQLGGYGGAGGPQQIQVILSLPKTGNAYIDSLFEQLRVEVRHRGGGGPYSAQRAFGQEWPR